MSLFLSTFDNKIDQKGRVSLPASFREVLWENTKKSLVIYESSINPCIEGCSISRIEELSNRIDDLDPFSKEKDAFSTIILGGSVKLDFDKDGRILLPKHLMDFANIKENATFIGKGNIFEIWNRELLDKYLIEARKQMINSRGLFSKNG